AGPSAFGFVFLARAAAWYRRGKEVVSVDRQWLTLRYDLDGKGDPIRFELPRVRNLRASPQRHNPREFWADFACGAIMFDYHDSSYRFGIGLGTLEAEALERRLAEWQRGSLSAEADV